MRRHRAQQRVQTAFGLRDISITNLPRTFEALERVVQEEGDVVQPYRPRDPRVQQADYHRKWAGQRKLLLAEIEFLVHALNTESIGTTGEAQVVYVGAAPGHHLKLLVWLFPDITHWHLVDPAFKDSATRFRHVVHAGSGVYHYREGDTTEYDDMLLQLLHRQFQLPEKVVDHHNRVIEKITLYVEPADELSLDPIFAAAGDMRVFISDIRTQWSDKDLPDEIEEKVKADMDLQWLWHERSNSCATLLKFRPPYVDDDAPEVEFEYLSGDIYLPVWGRWNTSECRLTILNWAKARLEGMQQAPTAVTKCKYFADYMHFFNEHVREPCNYEALCETVILRAYCAALDQESPARKIFSLEGATGNMVCDLSDTISLVLRDERRTGQQLPLPAALGAALSARPVSRAPLPPPPSRAHTELATAWNDMVKHFLVAIDKKAPDDVNSFEACLRSLLAPGSETVLRLAPDVALSSYPPGNPTVIVAARYNRVHILECLVEKHGCRLDVQRRENQNTVLHVAAYFAHVETVQWLLDRPDGKALRTVKNSNGETPLDAALEGLRVRSDQPSDADFKLDRGSRSPAPVALWLHEQKQYGVAEGMELVKKRAERVIEALRGI